MKIAICNEKTERVVQDWIDAVAALPERHSVDNIGTIFSHIYMKGANSRIPH